MTLDDRGLDLGPRNAAVFVGVGEIEDDLGLSGLNDEFFVVRVGHLRVSLRMSLAHLLRMVAAVGHLVCIKLRCRREFGVVVGLGLFAFIGEQLASGR